MSFGCIAGRSMTCVTDLNSKHTELENNCTWQDVCCVITVPCAHLYPLWASVRWCASCISRSSLCRQKRSLCLWRSRDELRSSWHWESTSCCSPESSFSRFAFSLQDTKKEKGQGKENAKIPSWTTTKTQDKIRINLLYNMYIMSTFNHTPMPYFQKYHCHNTIKKKDKKHLFSLLGNMLQWAAISFAVLFSLLTFPLYFLDYMLQFYPLGIHLLYVIKKCIHLF